MNEYNCNGTYRSRRGRYVLSERRIPCCARDIHAKLRGARCVLTFTGGRSPTCDRYLVVGEIQRMVLRRYQQFGKGRWANPAPRSIAVVVDFFSQFAGATAVVVNSLREFKHTVATVSEAREVKDGGPPWGSGVSLLPPRAECASIPLAVSGDAWGEEWLAD